MIEEHLFHIPRDPRERTNLKDRERARFEQLKAEWAAWNAQMLPYPPPAEPPEPARAS